jgi:hypothetical protein
MSSNDGDASSGGGPNSQASGSPPMDPPTWKCLCHKVNYIYHGDMCECGLRRVPDKDESPGLSDDYGLDSDGSGQNTGLHTYYKNTADEEETKANLAKQKEEGYVSTTTSSEESQSQAGPSQTQGQAEQEGQGQGQGQEGRGN